MSGFVYETILWWRFSAVSDQMVDPHHNESMCLRYTRKKINTTQTIDGDMIFLRGNSNREKAHGGGGKFTITRRFTVHICIGIS